MQRGGEIRIGLLLSASGPYATVARTMRNGARLAIAQVNADPGFPFTLDPVAADGERGPHRVPRLTCIPASDDSGDEINACFLLTQADRLRLGNMAYPKYTPAILLLKTYLP